MKIRDTNQGREKRWKELASDRPRDGEGKTQGDEGVTYLPSGGNGGSSVRV